MLERLAFVGAGHMAKALIRGLLKQGVDPERMRAADPLAAARDSVAAIAPIALSERAADAVAGADIVVFAVKPQAMAQAMADVRGALASNAVALSLAAGVPLAKLAKGLGDAVAIVRAMPNTPAQIGCGATALFADARADARQRRAVERVFDAVGITAWLPEERLLDAATALSGSGPAYFMLLIEALAQAGEALGLDARTAEALVVQTALGAARLVQASELDCSALREQVTSPGGATERALAVFERGDLRGLTRRAARAAAARAGELAELD